MIRPLQVTDIPEAMRLKESAGWNQVPDDWKRLLRLEPEGCFAYERDGTLVGSATALRYGSDLAWIGMVLVLPEFRRQGIATMLMQQALAWLRSRGVRASRLDASDMGRSLYARLGYREECPIERWARGPAPLEQHIGPLPPATGLPHSGARLDLDACGYDRRRLLLDFAGDASVEAVRSAAGFAYGRPGSEAWFVGPCVARGAAGAEALIGELLRRHGQEQIYWDLFPGNPAARKLAAKLGFRPVRRLWRMARAEWGPLPEFRPPARIYAAAGFEFG